ncbi:MAG: phosphoglycerate dehydrogenase [Alphaproteobacteria bacterium]|jgi:D-3-phosphoglycerate dehydrogenase / 2-oxoglutarate reductase|nr:phosphoglycerate dehydrogenase [Alphaproteobacteria bacterium]MBT5827762.1 phosphoglycerate dehydrogenase [Alphaproteobacteria bacterium]
MPKVLISDKMSPLAEKIFKEKNIDVDVITGLDANELCKIIGNYDGLAIRSSTKVNAEILAHAKKLKVIARAGIGVDNIDQNAATDHGVIVMNTPFGNSTTTAEHAIAMMFAIARQIPQANSSTHAGKWEKSKFMGTELTGKTLGVIGCGNIGSIVIKKALGLQMKVVGYDPYLTNIRASELGIKKAELDELFAQADFITLHVPLIESTKNIINANNIAKMKDGVFIVNCARGGLVNEADLKESLDSGKVAAAALDVFENEPAKKNVLFGHDNLICTPHLGASTNEAQVNVAVQVAEQISNYLNHNIIENSLNIPSVSPEDAKALNPYLKLGEILGSFIGQISDDRIREIKISYQGKVTKLNTKPITAVTLKSILTPVMEGVNIVNCTKMAARKSIKVEDVVSNEKSDYATFLNIDIIGEDSTTHIAGTLFQNEPRIVSVNQVKLEANLSPNLLFVKNEDKPGLIGDLGKFLGDKKINIANFHLGRELSKASSAIALIAIDQKISSADIEQISKMDSVTEVKIIKF